MPIEKVVLNASPIIILYKAHMENILPQLFKAIVIPKYVFDEITKTKIKDRAKVELPKQACYKIAKIGIDDAIAGWDLGKGESSVLSFALKNKEYRAVIDDAAARKCARTYNIGVLGTGSILLLAKRKGVIISLEEALQEIRKAGLWISDGLIKILKEKAGE